MSQSISAARIAGLVGDFERSPAYRGLADALRELIGDGRIGYGTRLPSERELTARLGVSRTTVTRAYAELRDSGYADARHGAGTFTQLPGGPARAHDRALHPGVTATGIDLVCAAASAPPGIAAAYAEAADELPAYLGGSGYYPAGLPDLQAVIAASYDARGLPTDPGQIIVTSGALAATAVVGRALTGPGDRVAVDSPTYPNAVQALRTGSSRLVTTPVEPDGWDVDGIAEVTQRRRPVLAHLMPDFHNPTGLVMAAADRERLATLFARHDSLAVVDEAHHELRLDGQGAEPPFGSFSTRTVTIGSASKSIWGGLRIGWIRSPVALVDRLTQARIALDLGAPVLEQLVLIRLLTGDHDRLLRDQRERLRIQRDVLVAALTDQLPSWRFRVPAGGMTLWCELPRAASTALAAQADRREVHLAPGPAFAPAGGLDRFVRVPFTLPEADLDEAVRRMAAAWADVGDSPAPARGTTPERVMVA